MLRTALRPRWLALLVVVLAAATGMALLGTWQLDRARERGRDAERKATEVARPLTDVLHARQTFPARAVGQRVTATGNWDAGRRLLVPHRELAGRTGYWVLVPLELADGSAVPVVRGWVPSVGDPAAAAPSGPVTLTGRLEPTEPPPDLGPGQGSGLPAGQIPMVAAPDLIARWPYPLLTGYLVVETASPDPAPAPAPVPPPPAPTGLAFRNLSYAGQWWLFAGFGLFLWWRLVRDDHLGRLTPAGVPSAAVGQHEAEQQPVATRGELP